MSVTAVGARRGLLGVPGLEEDVGMIGIHLPGGKFLELTPWTGDVEWSADEWGRWWLRARGQGHEALVEATCAPGAGAVLRAPTANSGLAPHCKDTFFGTCRMRVWTVDAQGRRSASPLVDATSTTAALEVRLCTAPGRAPRGPCTGPLGPEFVRARAARRRASSTNPPPACLSRKAAI